jgi:hypothetical protein
VHSLTSTSTNAQLTRLSENLSASSSNRETHNLLRLLVSVPLADLGKQFKMRRSRLRARRAPQTSERKRVRLAFSLLQASLAQTNRLVSSRKT